MNWPVELAGFITTILWPVTAGRGGDRGCINLIPLPECATFTGAVLSTKVFSDPAVPGPGSALTTWIEPTKRTNQQKLLNQQNLAVYGTWKKEALQ